LKNSVQAERSQDALGK